MTHDKASLVFIGSQLTPREAYLQQFVRSLQTACTQTTHSTKPDLLATHREIVLYTLQMLCACTGHRAVSDPFWNLDHFDLYSGQVLIDDKAVASQQGYRLSWLPALACQQVQCYLQHLRSLSRLVRKTNPALADQIWAISEPGFPRPMPLFFFLHSDGDTLRWTRILPGEFAAILEPLWSLPSNANRHTLSTWLHENNCSSELIDAQMGHVEAGCAPFGAFSSLAPDQVGSLLRPLLQRFLDAYGWVEVAGLSASRRLPACAPAPNSKALVSIPKLGAAVRLTNREALWRRDSEAVIALFVAAFPNYPPTNITSEKLNALEEQVITDAQRKGRVLVRLLLFRRHVMKLRRNGTATPLPGRMAIISPERHAFTDAALAEKCELNRLRDRFVRYLAAQEGSPLSGSRRLAELLVSSILFGAQTSQKFLNALPLAISNSTWRAENLLFVDVSATDSSPIWRWLPDRLSEALLIGHFNSGLNQGGTQDSDTLQADLLRSLSALLHALGAPCPSRTSGKPMSIDKLLEPLCQQARTAWKINLPAVVSAYAMGEHACASPPLSNWLRLVFEKAGSLPSIVSFEESRTADEEVTRIARLNDVSRSRKSAIHDWIDLTKCFGDRTSEPPPKTADSQNGPERAAKRSNARKNQFSTRIKALIQSKGDNLSPVVGCLAAWSLHLCANGTRYTQNLKANSVSSYVRAIGSTLTELAYEKDFLGLSDIALEDLYRCAVEIAPRKDQIYVVGRVREFHHFLQSRYGMPNLDWSDVVDEDLLEADVVDAGIITLAEFYTAIEIVLSSPEVDQRTRLARAAILILIYRFGLRTGEAFRLTVSDVLSEEDEIILYVRNSIHGETKTDHGMRQLPLLGEISGHEKQLLKQWLAHSQEHSDNDPLALLFPEVDDKRQGIDRTTTTAALATALRLASGDDNVRLRHLRHTCASRLFLAMLCPQMPDGITGRIYHALWGKHQPETVRAKLLGDSGISRRGLYAVAMYMGHASPKTTLRHYTHSADLVLKWHLDNEEPNVSSRALAYCYQVNYANLRQIRSRMHAAKGTGEAPGTLEDAFLREADIPRPNFQERGCLPREQDIELASKGLDPADLDRLLTIVTMRGTIEGLADRFLCSDYVVFDAIKEAVRQQELLGYTDFGLTSRDVDDYWVVPDHLRRPTLDKDSGRVRKFLSDNSLDSNQLSTLGALSDIWSNSYHPHSTALLIKRKSDLDRVISSWKALGMKVDDFEAIIPKAEKNQDLGELTQRAQLLKGMGFRVRIASRLPMRPVPDVPRNRVGLALCASKTHGLGYQATLDRVLFVMSVWTSLNRFTFGSQE